MAKNITIKPESLRSVQNNYEDLSSSLSDASTLAQDSASIEALDAGNNAIKATSADTKDTLNAFDQFLSSVATAFETTDVTIAQKIGDPTPDTLKDIKEGDAYKKLMARDTNSKDTHVGSF